MSTATSDEVAALRAEVIELREAVQGFRGLYLEARQALVFARTVAECLQHPMAPQIVERADAVLKVKKAS